MLKDKRSALLRFLLSVVAVVIGTAILGSMTSGSTAGGQFPESGGRQMRERPATTTQP